MIYYDFCRTANPNPLFTVEAKTFTVEICPCSASIGAWAACRECYELVVTEKWDELAMRATKSYIGLEGRPEDADVVFHFMRDMYEQLRTTRLQFHSN